MKIRRPEDRVSKYGGNFQLTDHGKTLRKIVLTLTEIESDKKRWALWYDKNSMSEAEAKYEVVKMFAMDTGNIDVLKINSNGA